MARVVNSGQGGQLPSSSNCGNLTCIIRSIVNDYLGDVANTSIVEHSVERRRTCWSRGVRVAWKFQVEVARRPVVHSDCVICMQRSNLEK